MTIKMAAYQVNKDLTIKQLDQYTIKKVPTLTQYDFKEVSFIYEEEGKVLGRIVGEIHWNYLRIELFYVDENTRGKGVGGKLLKQIEAVALEKNCTLVLLETMSFNAPDFYLKNGYEVSGRIDNHPLESETHYFMSKRLVSRAIKTN
ncbi:GNAT family N-acetyltransferase [Candidatus Enterococcus ferrettii]|uniref:N-acetyltransferase domain-containing protein n=1 Tax=Candidatus Enterococcus ferrettii TaxID=2815324 RepID=A0ABV0ET67_9ENTE|nr:GNAT family N-acetyltransferase [Enterococcus sp. 665A]MBO1340204.1 GNAT family N-acetyltransferase [Enterococcus sp. 665A]